MYYMYLSIRKFLGIAKKSVIIMRVFAEASFQRTEEIN